MAGASRKDVPSRHPKMGLVEEIEDLRPELHIDTLTGFEVLVSGKIEIVEAWPGHGVSSEVAISPWRGPGKRARVIPQVRSPQLKTGRYCGSTRRNATFCNSRRGIVAVAGIQVWTVG